jgi:hypothetical protein
MADEVLSPMAKALNYLIKINKLTKDTISTEASELVQKVQT